MLQGNADINEALTLDGNALAGLLQEIFEVEMTGSDTQCAYCGFEGDVGGLLAYVHAPGYVLRCPACGQAVLRIVKTPEAIFLDARGATRLCLKRR